LESGDEVEVHLSLTSKHPMEYVHLRDPRAAGFEPSSNLSQHKWDLGISWYEEIRDSGTNFFFEHLPQGEYTFKYRIRAATAGTFKVGACYGATNVRTRIHGVQQRSGFCVFRGSFSPERLHPAQMPDGFYRRQSPWRAQACLHLL